MLKTLINNILTSKINSLHHAYKTDELFELYLGIYTLILLPITIIASVSALIMTKSIVFGIVVVIPSVFCAVVLITLIIGGIHFCIKETMPHITYHINKAKENKKIKPFWEK